MILLFGIILHKRTPHPNTGMHRDSRVGMYVQEQTLYVDTQKQTKSEFDQQNCIHLGLGVLEIGHQKSLKPDFCEKTLLILKNQ